MEKPQWSKASKRTFMEKKTKKKKLSKKPIENYECMPDRSLYIY